MLFRLRAFAEYCAADLLALEELVVEALASGASTEGVGELYDDILDNYVQCRGRDCGTCNGVACEESVEIDMPAVPNAEALWQEADVPPSERILAAWGFDDIGGCHL